MNVNKNKLKFVLIYLSIFLFFLPVMRKNLSLAQSGSVNCDLNVEVSTDSEKASYQESVLKKLRELSKNDGDSFNEADRESARNLKELIEKFVDDSDNVSVQPENFDDYVVSFMNADCGEFNVLNRNEFEAYVNGENRVRLFRGINNLNFVDDLRKGKVFIGGSVRGRYDRNSLTQSMFGHCIYTTVEFKDALSFAKGFRKKEFDKSELYYQTIGDVVELAIDFSEDRTKILEIEQLERQILALKYFYPDFCNLAKIERSFCIYPEQYYSYHFNLFKTAFYNVFGFNVEEISKKLYPNGMTEKDISKLTSDISETLIYDSGCDLRVFTEFEKLVNQDSTEPHYIDKKFAVLSDKGLLTKLLGFDVLVRRFKGMDNLSNGAHVRRADASPDWFMIVNPNVLTICSDPTEKESVDDFKTWFGKMV